MAGSHVNGAHVPLGTHRAKVIADLVGGITQEESRARRRFVLRRGALMFAFIAIGLIASILDPNGWTLSDLLWSPVVFIAAVTVPFLIIEHRRLRPRAPLTQEEAERLAPAGRVCARCGEVPIAGMSVCPSCRNLLRPWAILVGSAVVLLLMLLAVLYRHGAFQS